MLHKTGCLYLNTDADADPDTEMLMPRFPNGQFQ